MKLCLIIMLLIIGRRINVGALYWLAYVLFCLAAMIGVLK